MFLSEFFLSPTQSEIGDVLVRIYTSGTRRNPQGQNAEILAAAGQQSCYASSQIRG